MPKNKCKDCPKCWIAVLLYEAGVKIKDIKKECKKIDKMPMRKGIL